MGVVIESTGIALPELVVHNNELGLSDFESVYSRTGIRSRRHLGSGEQLSELAVIATRQALKNYSRDDIGAVLFCTTVPERFMPNTSSQVQAKIGLEDCLCFDLVAACSSSLYGMQVGASLIQSNLNKKVLVVGADALSRFSKRAHESVIPLFGDAASCLVLGGVEGDRGFIGFASGSWGEKGECLSIQRGGAGKPYLEGQTQGPQVIEMDGMKVFSEAVNGMTIAANKVLAHCGLGVNSVAWVVAHQANYRIVKRVAKALGIDESCLLLSLEEYGNTGAASIPLTYHLGVQEKKFKPNDIVLFVSFGGGLSYGASLYRF